MEITTEMTGKTGATRRSTNRQKMSGFTLIELMIVMVIIAIGVALAAPSFRSIIEKRHLIAATEDIAAFMIFAQSEAIKRNEEVSVNIRRSGHDNWCVGAILGTTACDCTETDTTQTDYCDIAGVPSIINHASVISDSDYSLMHLMQLDGTTTTNASFSYDPVRGTLTSLNTVNFQMHSNQGSGSTREYGLQVDILPTGRVSICSEGTGRKRQLLQYPTCS